jgi:predicted NBD/HSP70 family sugar kinase
MPADGEAWTDARGAGAIFRLVQQRSPITRSELVAQSGLSRSTVSLRLEQLLAHGLISDAAGTSTGGRRPSIYAFNREAGVVLAAGMGATRTRVALTDLAGTIISSRAQDVDVSLGPEPVLSWLEEQFDELLLEAGRPHADLRGIGVGIPAPVEWMTGKPVLPPIMPGWDDYPIPERLTRTFGVPVLVDNDANVMALGEQRTHYPDVGNLLFVKIGTGIGGGIIAEHRVQRGADGSAGDLGHVHTAVADAALCRCGKFGCLEAVASGGAIARRLREQGIVAETPRAVVELVQRGNMAAIELVRESGRLVGEALAGAVNLLNPRVVVVGGELAHAEQHLMPGIRERVYQRSISLGTRHLRIVRSQLEDYAEVIGAAIMVVDQILSPRKIDELLAAQRA